MATISGISNGRDPLLGVRNSRIGNRGSYCGDKTEGKDRQILDHFGGVVADTNLIDEKLPGGKKPRVFDRVSRLYYIDDELDNINVVSMAKSSGGDSVSSDSGVGLGVKLEVN